MHAPSLNVETPNTQKRVQRFGVGDLVRVSYGGSEPYVGHIVEAVADPTDCPRLQPLLRQLGQVPAQGPHRLGVRLAIGPPLLASH